MGIKKPGNYTSPLAPGVGGQPQTALSARYPSAQPSTMQVEKGHAKDPSADPSVGTASIRPSELERTGARYRLRTEFPPTAPLTSESAGFNLANTPVVQDIKAPATGPDINHGKGTNAQFGQHVGLSRDGERAPGLA